MKPKKIPGIPSQIRGGFHDAESIHKIQDDQKVELKFSILKKRFFDVNSWGEYYKESPINFFLRDASGNVVHRLPQIGDYIKILLSEISNPRKEDYQWVQIDMIDLSNPERLMIQFRPSKLPGNEFAGETIHFYSSGSSTTFVISKGKDYIKAGIYGRNETANKNTGFVNSVKNMFIAFGSRAGSSKIQWKFLVDGFIGEK